MPVIMTLMCVAAVNHFRGFLVQIHGCGDSACEYLLTYFLTYLLTYTVIFLSFSHTFAFFTNLHNTCKIGVNG